MDLVILLAGIRTIAGFLHGLIKRDDPAMVILKTLAGFIGGLLFGVLLLVTVLRGLDM
jgi:hypothetical protein